MITNEKIDEMIRRAKTGDLAFVIKELQEMRPGDGMVLVCHEQCCCEGLFCPGWAD